MITIYKKKEDIPPHMQYVELNDLFFNQHTAVCLDDNAAKLIERIDGAKMVSKFKIESKFTDVILDVDRLSTGCKTVLNVLYFPQMVFCMKECGENALEQLYHLTQGNVYSEYAVIPFSMEPVRVVCSGEVRIIDDYEDLKEWWTDEE